MHLERRLVAYDHPLHDRLDDPLRLVLITLVASGATAALAETVTLRNGTVIVGSIVEMTETEVVLDTADLGRMRLKRRTVRNIADRDVSPRAADDDDAR